MAMQSRFGPSGSKRTRDEHNAQVVALDRVIAAGHLDRLAAFADWRRTTAEQGGSILGVDELQALPSRKRRRWIEMPRWLKDAWEAGILSRSTRRGVPVMVQPDGGVADLLRNRLSPTDFDTLTSGTRRWRSPGGAGRHDLCTTDALLRIGEHAPTVAAVLAESAVYFNDLAGEKIGADDRAGDGLISRCDGRHVVVETTATAPDAAKLRRKIDTSVQLLLRVPSIAVLFFDAAPPGTADARVWNKLKKHVAEAVAELHPDDAAAIETRLAISRWSWYWPSPHRATAWAHTLGAYHPTRDAAEPWRQVHYLDIAHPVANLAATPRGDELLAQAVQSPSNPYWLRTADRPGDATH